MIRCNTDKLVISSTVFSMYDIIYVYIYIGYNYNVFEYRLYNIVNI